MICTGSSRPGGAIEGPCFKKIKTKQTKFTNFPMVETESLGQVYWRDGFRNYFLFLLKQEISRLRLALVKGNEGIISED